MHVIDQYILGQLFCLYMMSYSRSRSFHLHVMEGCHGVIQPPSLCFHLILFVGVFVIKQLCISS